MDPSELSPRQHLRLALDYYQIKILREEEKFLFLEKDYSVELEKGFLFKLYWKGTVVAPFNQLDELCQHIKQS
ncbi:MAG: hypothetical protein AAF433_21175 [Bacteroidota bacterium]